MKPTLLDLKSDLAKAQNKHAELCQKLDKWERLFDAPRYGNKHHKGSRINPKLVRKQAEWRCASLAEPFLANENLFDIKGVSFEDSSRARQNALVLNNQFNTQIDKQSLVDKIVRGVVKYGTVIARVGWEYKEGATKDDEEIFEYAKVLDEAQAQALNEQYVQLAQLQQSEPDSFANAPSELVAGYLVSQEKGELYSATLIGTKPVINRQVLVNKPTIGVLDLRAVYVDPDCDSLDKAQYIICSYDLNYSELKSNQKYKNLDKLLFNKDEKTLARMRFKVYEYWGFWDKGDGTTKPIVATWCNDTLLQLEDSPFPDGTLPFVVFNYIPEDNSLYGIPDAELLDDNQAILGAVTRGVIDIIGKSANSQTGYAKGFLDHTNMLRYKAGDDYEYNPNFDPRAHIYMHKYPELPQSAMTVMQMMHNDAEALSGVKAFAGTGITASHLGDTAAGARGVLDAVSKREMSILRRLSHGFVELGRKLVAMNALFLSEQEVVRITNDEYVTIRRDDLFGKFDLSISIATAESDDSKAKELAFMLQTIGNTMGEDISRLLLAEIARLRKMPELAKRIEQYEPPQDELSQKMRELEVAKTEAQVALMHAEAQERMARASVQGAKVGVEQARAQSLQGDADHKALDFVRKDTGQALHDELAKFDAKNYGAIEHEKVRQETHIKKQREAHNQTILQNLAQQEVPSISNPLEEYV